MVSVLADEGDFQGRTMGAFGSSWNSIVGLESDYKLTKV